MLELLASGRALSRDIRQIVFARLRVQLEG